ncbi:hypothetical protein B0J13DRAFT_323215 [Dactylonectria estremocensis]|uniref:Uncharacterized protein n=1 Tax=Dactylonectria estremocensis TaxID=1079267 RepID=A0A9P9J7T0_9HYPO|nr:hypothetical protein B0J13DRAFT_323215 [Dactylonectria estremocensis]
MAPLYRKALVVGATSGIGATLASKLVATGTKVVAVGRRQDRLDALVQTHGRDSLDAVAFDVTRLADIQSFAQGVLAQHPDIDCVVINSGIQRGFDFSNPETLDLSVLGDELTTNYTSAVYLTAAFLPHLKSQTRAHFVYVGATLALIPSMIRTPNYNASKAALHSFIMNVRKQLAEAGHAHVSMVEVFPPAVQTELHDENHQPDLVNGGEIGMPVVEFVDRMYEGLARGDDQFAVGPGENLLKEGGWESQRAEMFEQQHVVLNNALAKYLRK